MSNEITTVEQLVYSIKPTFDSVLVDRGIVFEREAEFAIQAILANDYAAKIAMQNRQSVIDAVTNVAAIGISLNPAKKQAYLVPRKGGICLSIGYMGLLDMAMDSGSIKWGQARLVYAEDTFRLNGLDRQPTHEFDPFCKDRGEIIGVYVSVKTADGDYLTEAMSIEEVNAIRDRSDAWNAWVTKKKSCPWVTDWGEMAKKTCVHRAYKYWPKTERLENAIHYLNTDGGEGIALNPEVKQISSEQVDELLAKIDEYTDADSLRVYWPELSKFLRENASGTQYEHIKQAFGDKGRSLQEVATA